MNKEKINDFINNYNNKIKTLNDINEINNIDDKIKLNINKKFSLSKDDFDRSSFFLLLFVLLVYVIYSIVSVIITGTTEKMIEIMTSLMISFFCFFIMFFPLLFIDIIKMKINVIKLKSKKEKIIKNNKNIKEIENKKEIKKEIEKAQLIILNENELIKELLINNKIDIVELKHKYEIYEKIYDNVDLLTIIKASNINKLKNDFNQYIEEKNKNKEINKRLKLLKNSIEIH